jgi:putative transposase
VIETETVYVSCKVCGSNNVVKDGVRNGTQYYWCKNCRHKFAGTKALPGMKALPDHIATGVNLFYEGLSFSEISRSVGHIFNGSRPSESTIYEWVIRFTRKAIAKAEGYKAYTGPVWSADETVLDVAGGRTKAGSENTIWFWDVIDEDTRFLLGSHLSRTRTIKDAEALFTQAIGRSAVTPKHIVTDKLAAYLDGIERVFGSSTIHVQSQGMATSTHNNFIERFHGTLKQRTKVMRGLKSPITAKLVLDGWLIHYNYFRPHEGLKGSTPAQAAGINFPYRSRRDIIMADFVRV